MDGSRASGRLSSRPYRDGANAITRAGLPLPRTIFSGAAIPPRRWREGGRDPHPFLLLRETDEDHFRVVVGHPDEMDEPGLGERRNQPDPAVLEGVVDGA